MNLRTHFIHELQRLRETKFVSDSNQFEKRVKRKRREKKELIHFPPRN